MIYYLNHRSRAQGYFLYFCWSEPNLTLIFFRIEKLLKGLQSRIPVVSDAEKDMHKELKKMEENLKHYKNAIQQVYVQKKTLKVKFDFSLLPTCFWFLHVTFNNVGED